MENKTKMWKRSPIFYKKTLYGFIILLYRICASTSWVWSWTLFVPWRMMDATKAARFVL